MLCGSRLCGAIAIALCALVMVAAVSPGLALGASDAAPQPQAPATTPQGSTADASTTADEKVARMEQSEAEPINIPEEEGTKGASGKEAAPDKGGAMWRMFVGLVFVLGVIWLIHWLLKNYNKSRFPGLGGAGSAEMIEVVATTPLAPNRNLHVVRIGAELVLIGATDNGITHLRSFEPGALSGSVEQVNQQFQAALTNAMTGQPAYGGGAVVGGAPMTTGQTTSQGFLGRFITNLQMMTARS